MFNVGDKVIPPFKVGDRVKFKKSSVNTGMIDATEEDVFTVLYVAQGHMMLTEMGSWWNVGHFEHVKEGIMNNTEEQYIPKVGNYIPKVGDKVKGFKFSGSEYPDIGWDEDMLEFVDKQGVVSFILSNMFLIDFSDRINYIYPLSLAHLAKIEETKEEQEIKWQVGQEVFCLLRGKGVVHEIHNTGLYWSEGVDVYFTNHGVIRFKFNGSIGDRFNRSLFFSEPKIEAEKFPPKKLFVPAFQKGDVVAVKWADTVQILILEQETEQQVKGNCGQVWDKDLDVHFYKLGEEIIFN